MKTIKGSIKGYTLVEILVATVIIGVMAGLAVPIYQTNTQKSKDDEAKVNLFTIYTAERIYKANNGTYWAAGSPSVAQINLALNVNLAAPKYYPNFKITAGATGNIASSFKATVTET